VVLFAARAKVVLEKQLARADLSLVGSSFLLILRIGLGFTVRIETDVFVSI